MQNPRIDEEMLEIYAELSNCDYDKLHDAIVELVNANIGMREVLESSYLETQGIEVSWENFEYCINYHLLESAKEMWAIDCSTEEGQKLQACLMELSINTITNRIVENGAEFCDLAELTVDALVKGKKGLQSFDNITGSYEWLLRKTGNYRRAKYLYHTTYKGTE